MLGFKDPNNDDQWDWLRCAIQFDGAVNANANSRYWYITDHYSAEKPFDVGIQAMNHDSQQNWKYLGGGTKNYTECPIGEKCIFQCAASRNYVTQDEQQDYQFFDGPTSINFYYGVYYGEELILQGSIDYDNYVLPMTRASTLLVSKGSLALSLIIGTILSIF